MKNLQTFKEEATVSMAGGAMDNTVTPVSLDKQNEVQRRQFGKCRVYDVSTDTFMKCKNGKGRYERFKKYMGDGPVSQDIRQYAKDNPTKSIMIRDKQTGAHSMLKTGSKQKW